jgi:hypothetical protein
MLWMVRDGGVDLTMCQARRRSSTSEKPPISRLQCRAMSTQTAPPAPPTRDRGSSGSSRRIWIVVGLVIVAALITWLITKGGGDDKGGGQTSNGVTIGAPTVMSEDALRKFARAETVPIYWAGPQANRKYELTKTKTGRYYVRYLTPKASAGDPSPRFLTVGTYPGANAYNALSVVGRRPNTSSVRTRSGALVVYDKSKPSSVYFGFPGQNFQVEVYDPHGTRARRLVLSGQAQRLR